MNKKKIAIFAFRGETMCFMHTLLYALDFNEKGYDVKLVLEGSATLEAVKMYEKNNPFHKIYSEVLDRNLIDCACMACSKKMGSFDGLKEQGLNFCDELKGHPAISRYMAEGYEVVTL